MTGAEPTSILQWLASLPIDVLIVLVIVPVVLLSLIGTLLVRTIFFDAISAGSSVGPSKVQAAAEIYAVVVGFILVAAFAQFQDAKRNILQEVAALERLEQNALLLGIDEAHAIIASVKAYAAEVAVSEWPMMAAGKKSDIVEAHLTSIDEAIAKAAQQLPDRQVLHMRLSGFVDQIAERRTERLAASPDPKVAELIFRVMAIGTVLAIVVGWFLRGPSIIVHMILAGLMTAVVVALLTLSAQLLYPFSGSISLPPDEFLEIAFDRPR